MTRSTESSPWPPVPAVLAVSHGPLVRRVLRWVAWIAPARGTPIEAWRQRILASVLLGMTVMGFVAAVPGILLALRDGIPSVVLADLLAYGVVLALLFARRLPYVVRATAVAILPGFIGIFFLARFGFEAAGFPWLMAFPILGSVLLGMRNGVRCIAATAVVLGVFAWLIPQGVFPWANAMPFALSRFLVSSISVMAIVVLIGLSVSFMFDGLGNEATARAAAEQSASRLSSAIEQSDGLVLLAEGSGRVRYANGAARALLGDHFAITALEQWDGLRTGVPWAGDLRVTGVDGTPVCLSGTMSPVRTPTGEVTQVLVTMRDVRRERALESRLQQAQKLEAIGTLAGGIAHDFNNLLQPILLNTETALEQLPARHGLRPMMQDIRQAAQRAGTLVRRILTFTRSVDPERGIVDVGALLEETERLLRTSLPVNITLVTSTTQDAWVRADPSELQQVMLNLATNAVQAMPDGGALTLEVDVVDGQADPEVRAAMPLAERMVCISVSDTGAGMDSAVLRRAFEPFYTTKRPGEGTGLGLAMVHGTVTALGGVVAPESHPGAGTTMRVFLQHTGESRRSAAPPSPPASDAVRHHVLIVDDEPSVLTATARLMQRLGWTVDRCSDPLLASDRLDALDHRVDCVLTDLAMPGMSGVQLAEQVRRRHPGMPIVLMTGYLEHEELARARDHGIARVLAKPFSSSELAEVMASAVASEATG